MSDEIHCYIFPYLGMESRSEFVLLKNAMGWSFCESTSLIEFREAFVVNSKIGTKLGGARTNTCVMACLSA